MLTFFSVQCKSLSLLSLDVVMTYKGRRVWRMKRDREREKKEKEGEGEEVLSLFYSHFLLFRPRYASLQTCFWMHNDDVATLFSSFSLSHSLFQSLYISATQHTFTHTSTLLSFKPTHTHTNLLTLTQAFSHLKQIHICTSHTFSFFLSLSLLSSLFYFGLLSQYMQRLSMKKHLHPEKGCQK